MRQRFYQGLQPHPLIFQGQAQAQQGYDGLEQRQPYPHRRLVYRKYNHNHRPKIAMNV